MNVDGWTETTITIDGVTFATLPDTAKHEDDENAPGGGFTSARLPCENRVSVFLAVDDNGDGLVALNVDLGPEAEALHLDRYIDCEIVDGTVRPLVISDAESPEEAYHMVLSRPTAVGVETPGDIARLTQEWGRMELHR